MSYNQKLKSAAFLAFSVFVVAGTYNSVVINSESELSGMSVKFVKRLDEVNGELKAGRVVAASTQWKKLGPAKSTTWTDRRALKQLAARAQKYAAPKSSAPVSNPEPAQAAVQEELNLQLVEVVNPNKWKQGLNSSLFSGSLESNNGYIEGLSVSLPNGEGISINFAEMTGNVFEYDMDGDTHSAMMYQVDQNSYMVSLTTGPLQGTRLKFSSSVPADSQVEQAQQDFGNPGALQAGNFTSEQVFEQQAYPQDQYDGQDRDRELQLQGFNMEQAEVNQL